jgi:hypothetical protein
MGRITSWPSSAHNIACRRPGLATFAGAGRPGPWPHAWQHPPLLYGCRRSVWCGACVISAISLDCSWLFSVRFIHVVRFWAKLLIGSWVNVAPRLVISPLVWSLGGGYLLWHIGVGGICTFSPFLGRIGFALMFHSFPFPFVLRFPLVCC